MGFHDSLWNILFVKFGDPSCIEAEIQTDIHGCKNHAPVPAVAVDN